MLSRCNSTSDLKDEMDDGMDVDGEAEPAGFDPAEEDEGMDDDPNAMSHSERGEHWLNLHLKKAGRTREQLARVLWDANVTAVAELCDGVCFRAGPPCRRGD